MAKKKQNSNALVWIGILLAFVVLGFISNAQFSENQVTGYTVFEDFAGKFFPSAWEGTAPGVDAGVYSSSVKYMFLITVFLLLWGIFKVVNFPPGAVIRFLLSAILAYISVSFIAADELMVILQSYTALGITLTTVLPFIAIIFFSVALLGGGKAGQITVAKVLAQLLLWLAYAVILIYKLAVLILTNDAFEWNVLALITLGFAIISIGIVFFHKRWVGMVASWGRYLQALKISEVKTLVKEAEKKPKAS